MKKLFYSLCSLFIAFSLLVSLCTVTSIADDQEFSNEQLIYSKIDSMLANEHVSDEIIFFAHNDYTLQEVSTELNVLGLPFDFDDSNKFLYCSYQDLSLNFKTNWFKIRVNPCEMRDTLFKLHTSTIISSAYPNYIFSYCDSGIFDSVEDELAWMDSQIDAEANADLENVDINSTDYAFDNVGVREAWKKGFFGSNEITIGVLDSGYNSHEDVDPTRIVNPWDATSLQESTVVTDNHGHGTFIVGQICAKLDGEGVTGYTKNIKVTPIRIGTDDRPISDALIRAIQHAEDTGLDIINISCSFPEEWYDDLVEQNIAFSGIVVLCAGNQGCNIIYDETMGAATVAPDNWIIVGNSNSNDMCYISSNYSQQHVDLFAPGTEIQGLDKDGESYTQATGTSMAAPHVAAAAAIIMSHATHLSTLEVKQLLLDSVDPVSALEPKCVSGGRLSLINAVNTLYSASRPAYSRGEVNGDGKINAKDYQMLKRIVLGNYTPSANQLLGADANTDGIVDARDYMMTKRYVLTTYYFPPV